MASFVGSLRNAESVSAVVKSYTVMRRQWHLCYDPTGISLGESATFQELTTESASIT